MKHERRVPVEAEFLVIGYGNTLRCDDGVGPRVAEAVGQMNLPGVRTLACHQLSPEHADLVSRARKVIFVDAAMDEMDGVKFRLLAPGDTTQLMAHAADPRTLLALARDVFGRAPEAWWLTIPAAELKFGEGLSPGAVAGFQIAIEKIQALCRGLSVGNHVLAITPTTNPSNTAPSRAAVVALVGFRRRIPVPAGVG